MMENFCKLVCGAAVALFGVIVVADLMKPMKRKRSENMENYICINGQKVELAKELIDKVRSMLDAGAKKKVLADLEPGETFKVGEHEFVVLEHCAGYTSVVLKNLLKDESTFGSNNNYARSEVDKLCEEFSDELAQIIGEGNVVEHLLDLTAEDGLKDYGVIARRACLMTAVQYRMYVSILDKHKIDKWWWLATPHSAPAHEDDEWSKCVSPRGDVNAVVCNIVNRGVRPFCIFKSSIFVS